MIKTSINCLAMSQRITIILFAFLFVLGCKKDPKEPPFKTSIPESSAKKTIQKAYNFFSQTKGLEILYQSDAWNWVLRDAETIGLSNTRVAKLDSVYFLQYKLVETKLSIFDQRMQALPTFKNFKEMSQTLTGVPLDYNEELSLLYSFQSKLAATATLETIVLCHSNNSNKTKDIFPTENLQATTLNKLDNLLSQANIYSLELYKQRKFVFAVISSSNATISKDFLKKLNWSILLEEIPAQPIKEPHPQLDLSNHIFINWKEMTIL